MNWVAIDFETANAKYSSACALGIAIVEHGRIIKRASWLIRPRELYFNYYNTYIHGITEEDVKDKPQFNELWNDFKPFLEGKTVLLPTMQVLIWAFYGISSMNLESLTRKFIISVRVFLRKRFGQH